MVSVKVPLKFVDDDTDNDESKIKDNDSNVSKRQKSRHKKWIIFVVYS